ncbi:MAG: class I poly(R)-hydroxyalkanoic acid synthase [Rickettsiales bacterium]
MQAHKTDGSSNHNPTELAKNLAKIAEKSQLIIQEFLSRQAQDAANTPIDPLNIVNAYSELFTRMMSDPISVAEKQINLWHDYMKLWENTTKRLMGNEEAPIISPDRRDKRFKDETWEKNTVFDFIKQSYLISSRWIQNSIKDVEGLEEHDAKKIDFYTRQFVDAMSPSNFLMTNPEVLKTTIESNGENLVNGLENLLEDIENSKKNLRVSMTDRSAFVAGKNIANTKGKVIFRNDLMELIQYEPATKDVYKTPLLVMPAWINKYYILDLQEGNSYVKWAVEQGHTVFIISWVNPDRKLGKKTFDDYMKEGPLAAIEAIEQATGEKEVNVVAYCLGGTLLSITLAWLQAKKQQNKIKSATYLTTMIDFSNAGELSVFIDEEQIKLLESKMTEQGYLDGSEMAMTFNMLRANDLIWSFVVNNYLLGKDPFPFDLLYWNSDSTRMPATMHSFYLRNMYQKNMLLKPNALTIGGEPIDLRTVKTPAYMLSTREDHIAPWQSTYAATQIFSGDIRFVLAASGHIAGVINHPTKKKYCYWTNKKLPNSPDEWLNSAQQEEGSWWSDWNKWQQQFSGDKVPARVIGEGKLKPIEDAPGSYVKVMV